ncbi:unnamed protein product [Cylicocyclus nassatus]|uniref:Uncharacterized protein n=1 Tax=Cylicocyclus nassatus TaxID=53992 RepID=A0AA36DKC5_CYLNA|nr:unnamed protein product [Cylicocyclus nassatus]
MENVFRQSQEDELLLAYLSRSIVEKSTIEIQRDGRAFLTLQMVDNTTISGLMERNDGTPYNWEEIDDDNVWRGDRAGIETPIRAYYHHKPRRISAYASEDGCAAEAQR